MNRRLNEKITDFEQKGLSWLEPAREFVKSLNQAANLLSSPNPSQMTTFLKNIGSNHILRNRQFVFTPKIEYKLVAERSEANQNRLIFPFWCSRLESNQHRPLRRGPSYPLNDESRSLLLIHGNKEKSEHGKHRQAECNGAMGANAWGKIIQNKHVRHPRDECADEYEERMF